ncbi:MAG: type IV pilin N-terminal domain-containing protein [Thermoplasmatales archaeon]
MIAVTLKPVKTEDGVSEVVGTILILAVTVVLFSSIFVYVEQIPRATPPVQVYFSSSVHYSPSSDLIYENITDEGGSVILRDSTVLIIFIGSDVLRFPLDRLNVTSQEGHTSAYLEPGDTIHWSGSLANFNASQLKSLIQYAPTGQVLWQSSYSIPTTSFQGFIYDNKK